MSLPSPSLTPPSLSLYQLAFGGLPFGGIVNTATYQLQEIPEGLGPPDYVSGDVQRALDQGEYAGLDLSPGRNVTVKQIVQSATPVGLDEARQALGGVLGPAGSAESPLYIQMPSGLFACMARPRKHSPPWDVKAVLAHAQEVTTLFHATDPRWYSQPSKTATVGLPEPSGGLSFPFEFPAEFSGAGSGGLIEAVNDGKFECRPILIVTGPCTNPRISNLSLPGAPSIGFDLTLNPGDTLTIDTIWPSATLVSAGTTGGSSRLNSEQPGNTWFGFPPGVSLVEFTTGDTSHVAGTLTANWANTYMAI